MRGQAILLSYEHWQQEVLRILQNDSTVELKDITSDEVDWPAWVGLYTEGKSPLAAVNRALERDFKDWRYAEGWRLETETRPT